jgi:hypothetical protein
MSSSSVCQNDVLIDHDDFVPMQILSRILPEQKARSLPIYQSHVTVITANQ